MDFTYVVQPTNGAAEQRLQKNNFQPANNLVPVRREHLCLLVGASADISDEELVRQLDEHGFAVFAKASGNIRKRSGSSTAYKNHFPFCV